ncbi:MAG: hypothetical protein R6U44_00935 [Archaeoglobaceae archaeon]
MELVKDVLLYSKTELDQNGEIKTEDWVMLIGSRGSVNEVPLTHIESGEIPYNLTEEAKDKLNKKLQDCQPVQSQS